MNYKMYQGLQSNIPYNDWIRIWRLNDAGKPLQLYGSKITHLYSPCIGRRLEGEGLRRPLWGKVHLDKAGS